MSLKGIADLLIMIPKGGKYATSVVNKVYNLPQNWETFKTAVQQIEKILKSGKLKLDGKQTTIFESNKNILKNHEKVVKVELKDANKFFEDLLPPVTKKYPPFNVSKEDFTKGWTPTVVKKGVKKESDDLVKWFEETTGEKVFPHLASQNRRVPPVSKYTAEMEKIDEELDALAFGGDKYAGLSSVEKAKIFKKLQTEMDKLIKVAMKEDLTTLSLSQINKKSQNLQKRIREISENPDIKGTVTEGPKRDMIKALYDSENPALTKARHALITKKNSELKYGKKYPVLDPDNNSVYCYRFR